MSHDLKQLGLALLLLVSFAFIIGADNNSDYAITVTTSCTKKTGADGSKEKTRAITMFDAKLQAVKIGAKYLTNKGLLEHYGKKQNEIFCLAVNEIRTEILSDEYHPDEKSYYIKIKSIVTSIAFIKAQIKDQELENNESHYSYSREMEQPLAEEINPGEELSRAYRYIANMQWRVALIYLNHLEKKYPNWGEVFLAKAIAFYGEEDEDKMIHALRKACALDSEEACHELQGFTSHRR